MAVALTKVSNKPAKRILIASVNQGMPDFSFSHNCGAKISDKLLPIAKLAILIAPLKGLACNEATNKAEYNKPHGISTHSMPVKNTPLDGPAA